jgi:hypothetical protein
MVESKAKTGAVRARLAHKLAKYVRATPIHLTGVRGGAFPSTSHLSIPILIQHSEEPQRGDLEIKIIPGTQLTMNALTSLETPISPKQQLEENPSHLDQSLFSSPAKTEEEELLFSRNSNLEIFWLPDPTQLMESLLVESTQPTFLPLQPKSPLMELTSLLMINSSKKVLDSPRTN